GLAPWRSSRSEISTRVWAISSFVTTGAWFERLWLVRIIGRLLMCTGVHYSFYASRGAGKVFWLGKIECEIGVFGIAGREFLDAGCSLLNVVLALLSDVISLLLLRRKHARG